MKSTVIALFSFLFAVQVSAQVADNDSTTISFESLREFSPVASGVPFSDVRYVEAQGTAYFDQQWLNSTVITTDGKAYKSVPIRIDLLDNKIHFKAEDGREMVVRTPLKEVQHEVNGKLIRFVNGQHLPNKRTGWFQVLVNDSVSLIKSYRKFFEEKPSYGGNVLYIKTTESYFVYLGDDESPIKKASELTSIMPDKKAELEAETKKLKSQSKEEQLIGVVKYLNTLLKK